MKKINGTPKVPDVRSSIVLDRQIKDIDGRQTNELFEDEATWRLMGEQVGVPIGPPVSPLEIGVKQRLPQTVIEIIPLYEVIQIRGDHSVCFRIPAARAYIRMPCHVRTEKNVDGSEKKTLKPYREVIAERHAKAVEDVKREGGGSA